MVLGRYLPFGYLDPQGIVPRGSRYSTIMDFGLKDSIIW